MRGALWVVAGWIQAARGGRIKRRSAGARDLVCVRWSRPGEEQGRYRYQVELGQNKTRRTALGAENGNTDSGRHRMHENGK